LRLDGHVIIDMTGSQAVAHACVTVTGGCFGHELSSSLA